MNPLLLQVVLHCPEDQLRLLNGDYPDKELTVGRVIKIVD